HNPQHKPTKPTVQSFFKTTYTAITAQAEPTTNPAPLPIPWQTQEAGEGAYGKNPKNRTCHPIR
ncbi:MAG: hypothetical protein KDK34_17810, partial [Leptospiraceae bacterium]|nr:hypothetical protein [Leptospiraceae bacterium]